METRRKIIRVRHIAQRLSISERTVRRYMKEGRLLKITLSPHCTGTTPEGLEEFLKEAERRGLEE